MGMYYVFNNHSDNYSLDDNFPDGLGWFSERVGTWGEESEFCQLERILDIDLKLLDHTRYNWEDEDCPGNIETTTPALRNLIQLLKQKINSKPDFYKQITFRENHAEECRKYLATDEFMNDLDALLAVMKVYDDNRIVEFEISYG